MLCRPAAAVDPDLRVNNLTGSDPPAASGAPANFGPFSALATCHTNGVNTNVIQWALNPLAGVPTDGSAVLWLGTASGRRLSKITARTATTVTVEDSFNISAASPVDCAVGGKVASITSTRWLGSRNIGWTISIEDTGTPYVMAASVNVSAAGNQPFGGRHWTMRGVLPDTNTPSRPTLRWTGNNVAFIAGGNSMQNAYVRDLILENTSAVKTNVTVYDFTNDDQVWRNVKFVGFNGVQVSGSRCLLIAVEATGGPLGISSGGSGSEGICLTIGSYSHDNSGAGFFGMLNNWMFYDISANNTGPGHQNSGGGGAFAVHSTFYGNGGDGIQYGSASSGQVIVGNLITNNTGVGLLGTPGTADGAQSLTRLIDANAYFANTGGNYNNAVAGPNDTTGLNPAYTNPAGLDWSIGPALSSRGWPPSTIVAGVSSTTTTGTEPGASQRSGGAGAANYAY
jgi:hypothetical protein